MSEQVYQILIIASHPVQYSAPIFRLMSQHPNLKIQVAYCSLQGAEPALDSGFGMEIVWDIPLLNGYPWVQLSNRSLKSGSNRIFGLNHLVWRMIQSGTFDAVVILTGYWCWSFWIAVIAAKLNHSLVLFGTDSHELHSRGGQAWKAWLKPLCWSFLFRLADVVILPSSGGVALMRSLGIPRERLALTPYVVDNDWWKQQSAKVDRLEVRAQWHIPNDAVVVLFCAKLQPWKRPQDVLRAFVQANVPGSYLVFAGEGPLRQELQQEAQATAAEKIKFLGFVNQSQLPAVYRAADLLVFPSEYEPFGVVVNEAMLCGCPVVVSDRVGARYDLVRDGETGFVYPWGNTSALAEILSELLIDVDRLKAMGEAAQERMSNWSPRENVDALLAAIDQAKQRSRFRWNNL